MQRSRHANRRMFLITSSSAMRILVVTFLVGTLVLSFFLMRERAARTLAEQQQATATARVAEVTNQLESARQQLHATEATLRDVRASRDELAARGNVIASISLRIELSCVVRAPITSFPKIVTLVTLAKRDGTSLRFIDDTLAPSAVHNVTAERADVTLEYRPLHPSDVLGHQLDELREISTLGIRYNDVLASLGLTLQDVSRVVLIINEVPTFQLEHLGSPSPPNAGDFAAIDVSPAFAEVTSFYTRALQERIRTRAQ